AQHQLADLDRAAILQEDRLRQALAVEERPACAAHVLEYEAAVASHDRRMLPRNRLRLEHDVTIGIATDDGHLAIEREKPARRGTADDLECRDYALRRCHGIVHSLTESPWSKPTSRRPSLVLILTEMKPMFTKHRFYPICYMSRPLPIVSNASTGARF